MNETPDVCTETRPEYEIVWNNGEVDVNEKSIFQIIRNIRDPEHSYTLEELRVVSLDRVSIRTTSTGEYVHVVVIPTIPHCSMVGLIGLSILYKLFTVLSSKYIVRVEVEKDSHTLADEVTKQLSDIERTYAAFLNPNIISAITPLL
ncbi:hypothetical protein NEAUS04_0127 [Nematocida ausubeli]|nr:hypothetical protein NEAUS06_0749 [Nematocida ausubeli]KAI5137117.1 hypothetical protein NEAUS07_1832 [Nematocida ausubeli]KAI5149688.1 hypothetical protein NEAUS05_1865 [Nematocida ausubeli]KAI5160753.1 hypothetical protein NEAUS04_0127 [Nematocida ausubeli]